jgi:hypothetical protein
MSFNLLLALPAFQPFFGFEMVCGALFEIWLIGLFLKSVSVSPTNRAYLFAFLVSVALMLVSFAILFVLGEQKPFSAHPFAAITATLAGLAIYIWVIKYLFCLICQTLVDETPNLLRSLQGVSGRLGRVWLVHILGTIFILSILAFLDLFVRAPPFSTGQFGDFLLQVRDIVALLLGYVSNIFIAALTVVWFLSPIQRPPEESTTWVVPEGSLQR